MPTAGFTGSFSLTKLQIRLSRGEVANHAR